jgi:hypothetical protein
MKRCRVFLATGLLCVLAVAAARADSPETYRSFTASGQAKHGLFTIWQREGKTYLELAPGQLNKDYLETIVPGNGTGDAPVWWGDTDYLPTELVRFERRGNQIVVLWPNWYAIAPGNPSAQVANASNLPDTVAGVEEIAAENRANGDVIFDVSSLLNDQLDLRNVIDEALPKDQSYSLNPQLSYVDSTKAFPENDVITVAQTWQTDAKHVIDTAPDARRLRINVVYNFVQLPSDDYKPRLADDRVGIYDDIYVDFSHDQREERQMRYLVRWNFDPEDPNRPSRARHPMVMYLSNTVPPQYRAAITDACLEWNKAFAKIGILDAVQVRPQPNDPNWDPDDFRYNVIRWLNETRPSFGADSQTLFDPRTGEEIRTGVLVSAVIGMSPYLEWKYLVDPVRFGRNTDPVPAKFVHDLIFAVLLHEMGHNMGLQHNFIGHEAYTAAQLRSEAFTATHGVASSAMEYAPLNLWPKGTEQGEYFQTTIGPYDYYAIKFGYASIPGTTTPEEEAPTLSRWAAAWSNAWTRYASDEDVSWDDGHAADPRVEQGTLTNDEIGWCETQMRMRRGAIDSLNRLWPLPGAAFEEETNVFRALLGGYFHCATVASHFIGGQYLSRAHQGDAAGSAPVVPVRRAEERRAFDLIDRNLFNAAALAVPAPILQHLGYSEWAGYGFTSWEGYGNLPVWAYDPPARHDFPLVEQINHAQLDVIRFFFQPLVLQRIDENPTEATSQTMSIADLFNWLHESIYRDLSAREIPLMRRNLQAAYVVELATLANRADDRTPSDARSLARTELVRILHDARRAERNPHDEITRAHLVELVHRAMAEIKT